eukprot:2136250-Prymnesium_polylepis.1
MPINYNKWDGPQDSTACPRAARARCARQLPDPSLGSAPRHSKKRRWDHIELSDDEDNFHPNIDNNLMIRLQREKREQREAEEAAKKKKLEDEGTTEAKAELDKMEKTKKLHVGNISQD